MLPSAAALGRAPLHAHAVPHFAPRASTLLLHARALPQLRAVARLSFMSWSHPRSVMLPCAVALGCHLVKGEVVVGRGRKVTWEREGTCRGRGGAHRVEGGVRVGEG